MVKRKHKLKAVTTDFSTCSRLAWKNFCHLYGSPKSLKQYPHHNYSSLYFPCTLLIAALSVSKARKELPISSTKWPMWWSSSLLRQVLGQANFSPQDLVPGFLCQQHKKTEFCISQTSHSPTIQGGLIPLLYSPPFRSRSIFLTEPSMIRIRKWV